MRTAKTHDAKASTHFDGKVDQTWDLMTPGDGIDALTGFRMPSALKPFEIEPANVYNHKYRYYFIQSEEDFSSCFSAEVGVSYNMANISVEASAALKMASQFSKNSISILATCHVVTTIASPADPKPTQAALTIYAERPNEFRKYFGDYAVVSAHFGASFYAIYNCTSSNIESLTQFKSSMETSTNLLEVKGAAEFSAEAKQRNVETSISWFMEGASGSPGEYSLDAEGVAALCQWFKSEAGSPGGAIMMAPRRAVLEHYSGCIGPNIPTSIDIDPGVFHEIGALRTRLAALVSRTNDLPQYYLDGSDFGLGPLGVAVRNVAETYRALAPSLPNAPNELLYLRETAEKLTEIVNSFGELVDFYQALMAAPPSEAASGKGSVTFGFTDDYADMVPVPLRADERELKMSNGGLHTCHDWLQFPFDPVEGGGRIIVGWQLVSLKSSNGSWNSGNGMPIIGARSCFLQFSSSAHHDLHWRVTIWSVALADFPWVEGDPLRLA